MGGSKWSTPWASLDVSKITGGQENFVSPMISTQANLEPLNILHASHVVHVKHQNWNSSLVEI